MDVNLAIMLMTIMIIFLLYGCIGGRYFAKPYKILFLGLFFVFFSFLYKFILLKILHSSQNILDAAPFIDMSTAALGGNLIAAAFIIKAQKEHNQAKININQSLAADNKELEYIQSALSTFVERKSSMSEEEYDDLMVDALKRITKLNHNIVKLEEEHKDISLL